MQSVAFLKTILLQSDLSPPFVAFLVTVKSREQKWFVLLPLLLCTASLAPPLTAEEALLYPYLVSDPPCYPWWQLLDQFPSVPPPVLAGT